MSLSQHTLPTLWLPLLMLAVLVLGAVWLWWLGRCAEPAGLPVGRSALTSVQGSAADASPTPQPQAALVLGTIERKAYRLLRESFPRAEVLAHVQLLRFIRLPPRDQREGWMHGTGMLDVDLLLCDGRFRVLAAVDVRTRRDTPAGKKRSERMARVLQAAGITVHIWHEESLPNVAEVRRTIAPMLAERKARAKALEEANANAGLLAEAVADAEADNSHPHVADLAAPYSAEAAQGAAGEYPLSVSSARPPIDFATYKRAATAGRLQSS